MSESASFGGIASQGVQDVAALLPLLGTEQCKKHVSLSLQHRYLYAAVAPLSIFGSLGIALAGLWIGFASTAWGVRGLKHTGFEPSSDVAKIIALDNRRYLAETNLIAALEGLQTQGLQDRGGHMQIGFKDPVAAWNFRLIISGLIAAGVSLSPYLHFIIVRDTSRRVWACIFPVMRALGGFFCVIGAQQLLQRRILTVLQQRLDFIYIAKFLKNECDVMSIPSPREKHVWPFWNWRKTPGKVATPENVPIRWDDQRTSEECLQDLYRYLELFDGTPDEDMKKLLHHISGLPDKTTAERLQNKYPKFFTRERPAEPFRKKHLTGTWLYWVLIFVGVLASVAGYIGCFSLVQDAKATSTGRYTWIILEAVLAIIRMMVWALNPSFDDMHGLQVCLDLSDKSPRNLIKEQGEVNSKTLPTKSTDPKVTLPILNGEAFYDAFVKYSGYLPPLKVAESTAIVPCYTILEDRLCVAFTTPTVKDEALLVDFQSGDATPFTLYRGVMKTPTTPAMSTGTVLVSATSAPATGTPKTTIAAVKLEVTAQVEAEDPIHANKALLQELTMHYDFIDSVLENRPASLRPQSCHSFDVGWLVRVEHYLSRSKDPNEAWEPVRERAETLMGNLQDITTSESELIYSGNQALYFYHEKLRSYYGRDETPNPAFRYFKHVKLFFSDYVKRVRKGLDRQPDKLNQQYKEKRKEYMKGVGRVNKLLFSWKSWQWYRSHIPMTGYDQAGLDGTLTYLAHTIWNIELYDVIAGENGHEDFKEHCRKLPEDATPEVETPSKAATVPRTIARREGRSFLAKIFCRCTGSPEESPEDIEKSEDLGFSGLSDVPRLPY